jgi:hypothetical protein
MANVKITQLPAASSVTTDDLVPIVDVGTTTTQKATLAQILALGPGQNVFWLVEGGQYATLQDAFNAASEGDVIVVGPKTSGTWGDLTIAENKTMSIVGLNAPQGKTVKIGAITFSPSTPSLNINRNEYFFANLMITGSFASQAVLFSGTGAGRMRFVGCYFDNNSATGDGIVNSNTHSVLGVDSSLYLDNCVVQVVTTTGVALRHSGRYTWIKNRTQIEGGLHAIEQTAGIVEVIGAAIVANGATSTVELSGTAYLPMGYSTISNSSDAAGAIGVNVNSATATFGAGDSTIAVGSSGAAAGAAVAGSGVFTYTNVSFSYASSLTVTTKIPANNLIGNVTTDISVNSAKIGRGGGNVASNFVFSSTGLANNTSGSNSIAIGSSALRDQTTGIRNVGIGTQALRVNVSGTTNTAVGYFALDATTGSSNTAVGASAGANITSGTNLTCIGAGSSPSSVTGSNEVTLGGGAADTLRVSSVVPLTPNPGFSVTGASATTSPNFTRINVGHTQNSASAAFASFFIAGANVGGIRQAAGGGTPLVYATSSDYRVKTDVQPIETPLTRLDALKPCRFHFTTNPDGPLVEGFIAHEVQAVVPQAVVGEKDAVDAEGNPVHQGLDQAHLVPLLTAACQALHTKNQQLESRLAALEAAISALSQT